ncbi:MAG: Rrf2 family transcriptional regulator [Elusimicrobia bacterium]|nr:Rrf2 family transcriptional regulator [Elusimicrobiota bacterium]
MRLTAGAEYSLRAVLFLSRRESPVRAFEIACSERIPLAALRPVLRWLCAKGILISQPGRGGGYSVRRDLERLTLRQVLETVEGPLFLNNCLLHGVPCTPEREHWCPVHAVWTTATSAFLEALGRQSIAELSGKVHRWETVDSMLHRVLRGAAGPGPVNQ